MDLELLSFLSNKQMKCQNQAGISKPGKMFAMGKEFPKTEVMMKFIFERPDRPFWSKCHKKNVQNPREMISLPPFKLRAL